MIWQLVENQEYMAKSKLAVPAEFKVANEPDHPMFVQVDFGLVRDAEGELQPKLVELQAFPSLYAYQGPLAEAYVEAYGSLFPAFGFRLSGNSSGTSRKPEEPEVFLERAGENSYRELLRPAIVGQQDPENVILMEIDPSQQKTLPDFHLTEKMLGVRTVDIVDIRKDGARLYYTRRETGFRSSGFTTGRLSMN